MVAVEADQPIRALAVSPSDDAHYANQWGFTGTHVDFPGAWAGSLDGTGVRVAVIDSGVQADHPDLDAQVVQGKDFVVPDSASNFGRIDGHGHGTHVAGTIAAEDNIEGVVGGAPGATIVPTRVLDCTGSGSVSAVADGILWASDQSVSGGQVRVINLSLGTGMPSTVLESAVRRSAAAWSSSRRLATTTRQRPSIRRRTRLRSPSALPHPTVRVRHSPTMGLRWMWRRRA